jgi:hypothetical protein
LKSKEIKEIPKVTKKQRKALEEASLKDPLETMQKWTSNMRRRDKIRV